MLGLMAFVGVLFADSKEILYPYAERDPFAEFIRKYPEIKNEYVDGYLECVKKEVMQNWFRSTGYHLRSYSFRSLKGNQIKILQDELKHSSLYNFEFGGLRAYVKGDVEKIEKYVNGAYRDCHSELECKTKGNRAMLMVEADVEFCIEKAGGSQFKDENFMEPGNKWYELYQKFLTEEFKQ